jgi:hypothetical protein
MPELWLPPEERLALWEPEGEQVRIIGWRPGPAGLSSVQLAPGLEVLVDHASPTTLAEISLDLVAGRLDDRHLPLLASLLGEEAAERLRAVPGSNAHRRPRPIRPADVDRFLERERLDDPTARTFARLALAADVGEDGARSDVARGVAWLESGLAAAELGLRQLVAPHLRRGAAVLAGAAPPADRKVTYRLAGLARKAALLDPGLRPHIEQVLDHLLTPGAGGATGDRPLRGTATSRAAASAMPLDDLRVAVAMPAPAAAVHRELAESQAPGLLPLEVEGEHRAWAGLTRTHNVLVSGPSKAHDSWARVFRRSDGLLLGLSPMRRSAATSSSTSTGATATVVVPPSDPHDLVVDLVADPSTPRRHPAHDAVRSAVDSGRRASRLSRLGDPRADEAWAVTAERWRALGDVQRANLAERHGRRDDRRPVGSNRSSMPRPLVSDELP